MTNVLTCRDPSTRRIASRPRTSPTAIATMRVPWRRRGAAFVASAPYGSTASDVGDALPNPAPGYPAAAAPGAAYGVLGFATAYGVLGLASA